MLNSLVEPATTAAEQDAAVDAVVRSGARGALFLAASAVAVVIGLWFVFYLVVFLPRAAAP